MKVRVCEAGNLKIAVCESSEVIIRDGQTTLDFAASIASEYGCQSIAINKSAICEDFFILSTGIAGEVAQKFVNYRFRAAIIGDFSGYTSKSLKDYIYECNKYGPLYFVSTEDEAVKKLGAV
jgi:hypothetical protein